MSDPYGDPFDREPDPEPVCARCEAPESWCVCLPIVLCPQCGAEHEDADGFGVLFCSDCGFCVCASVTGNRCEMCGRTSHAA